MAPIDADEALVMGFRTEDKTESRGRHKCGVRRRQRPISESQHYRPLNVVR